MYVGISLMYASVAGALVSFVEPLAAGSGIAEVKTYLNGIHIRGLLAVRHPPPLPHTLHRCVPYCGRKYFKRFTTVSCRLYGVSRKLH